MWSRASLAAVLLGVGLRVAQWLGNPSLWLDELQLVRNILDRRMVELLFQGLDRGQVAPVGYLLPTKAATLVFGDSELALRVVPLGASILALVLFWRLAQGLLGPPGALAATAGFAMNPLLISLGAVVKQYATDVLGTVIILVALRFLWQSRGSLRQRILVGLGAGAVGFLSIPSIMVACAATAGLLYRYYAVGKFRRVDSGMSAMAPLIVWGAVALAGALWARALMLPGVADRTAYWTRVGGFAPPFTEYPTWVLDRWTGTVLPEILLRPYIGDAGALGSFLAPLLTSALGWIVLMVALLCAGTAVLALRGFGWAVAMLLPFPVALVLARIGIYPIDGRTSVFLLPLLLLLMGALVSWLVLVTAPSIPSLKASIPVIVVALFAVILVDRPPIYVVQQDRAVIREVAQRTIPSEPIFAHGWSRSALAYYGPRFGLTNRVVVGNENRDVLREDLEHLDALRGEPSLWVLFNQSNHRDLILCYLNEVGRELDRVSFPGGMRNNPVSLHRYDLSDDTRWASLDTPRSPLTAEAFEGSAPRCRRQEWRTDAARR